MYNFRTVFWFEVARTLKKKSFWIISLLVPFAAAAVVGIIFFSNKTTTAALEEITNETLSIAVNDQPGIIDTGLVKTFGGRMTDDHQRSINDVKAGTLDAYIYYPKNIATEQVEVYAKDAGLFDNSKYSSIATRLLEQSVASKVPVNEAAVLQGTVRFDVTTYRDGAASNPKLDIIAPGLFLVLFYFLIAFFGNQMLTSTTEEKENRVIEMILTTVRAKTLIVGKIFSLVVLGLLQTIIIVLPIAVGYFLVRERLSLPNFDLSALPFDPARIAIGAAILATSFVLFTGLLVAIGAAVPTAKEAGGFFGTIMLLIFGPLYAAPLFVSSPDTTFVQVLSYFPLTAPIPLLLRNAVGNLEYWQAGLAIAILIVTAIIVFNIAVRIFRYGALEYSRKLSLREIFQG
ncbi:sodium transporter [Candidatus Saccharibacteria bacterium]|nr:MAG: sodium transporter [Candidatus Saccharibacteria bacterium]